MLGERIQTFRLSRGLGQIHLADACGTTKKVVESWETNKREPTLSDLVCLANLFRVSLDQLVGREAELS